MFLFIHCT